MAVEQTASSRIKYIGEITKKPFALPSPIFSCTGGTLLFALEENVNRKEMKMDTSQCFKSGSTDAKNIYLANLQLISKKTCCNHISSMVQVYL